MNNYNSLVWVCQVYNSQIYLLGEGKEKNYKVAEIYVTSTKWFVSQGIRVGSVLEDVKSKFGRPYHKTEELGMESFHYGNDSGSATFSFKDNKLVEVNWSYNFC